MSFFFNLLTTSGSPAPPLNAAYQAILDYNTANGITSPDQYQAINWNKGIALAADSTLWNKILTWHYFKDINKSFGKVNLKSPGVLNAIEVGTVNYVADQGISPNDTSSWYRSQVNPTVTDVRGISYKSFNGGSNKCMLGARVNSSNLTYVADTGSMRYAHRCNYKLITYPTFTFESSTKKFSLVSMVRDGGTVYLYDSSKHLLDSNTTAELTAANTEILYGALGDSASPSLVGTSTYQKMCALFSGVPTAEELFNWFWANQFIESGSKATRSLYTTTVRHWQYDDIPDVYIFIGQSNSLGHAPFSTAPEDYKQMHPNCWVLRRYPYFEQLNNGNDCALESDRIRHGIEIKLARLINDNTNKPVYIIKATVGGTGWAPTGSQSFNPTSVPPYNKYAWLKDPIKYGLDEIIARHGSFNLKATICIAGESAAQNTTDSGNYTTDFETTIEQLKTDTGVTDFKIYMSKLSSTTVGSNPHYATVNSSIDQMLVDGDIDGIIETEGLATQDGQHYTSQAYDLLAERFFDEINP